MYFNRIMEVNNVIRDSSTEPLDAIIDSKARVIIKLHNNIQGNLALINEYICYKLAVKLDLPVPVSGIGFLNNDVIDNNKLILKDNYGPCFYSTRIDKATIIKSSIIPLISNKNIFFKILVFDHLVYNKDRNLGNLLVTLGSEVKLFMIDHSHAFKNDCIWDKYCFIQGMGKKDYLDDIILTNNSDMYSMFFEHLSLDNNKLLGICSKFQNSINKKILDEIIDELPKCWYKDILDDVEYLKKYIMYRLNNLDKTCNNIINLKRRR